MIGRDIYVFGFQKVCSAIIMMETWKNKSEMISCCALILIKAKLAERTSITSDIKVERTTRNILLHCSLQNDLEYNLVCKWPKK